MRFLLLLCFYVVLLISQEPACQQKPTEDSDRVESILLTEFTRGTQRSIEVSRTQTKVRLNDTEETTPTPAEIWQELTLQVTDLPYPTLAKIPIISKKHQVDAALHANLTVVTSDSTYTSDTFDHNAPPEQLQAIVDGLYRQIPASMREQFQR